MQVDEIHFNHTPSTADSNAFNLRYNATGPTVVAPEWSSNGDNAPAAYASRALGEAVTIKARFSGGPANARVQVRAMDTWTPASGLVRLIVWAMKWVSSDSFGGVLGDIELTEIHFDANGDSGLVTLPLRSHRLGVSPVGTYHVPWLWQVRTPKGWHDIVQTKHQIYVVHDLPHKPWNPVGAALDDDQIPWVEALEKACLWAEGTTSAPRIAAAITRAVNALKDVGYTENNVYWDWEVRDYELTAFLSDLADGAPFRMNCRAAADAVVAFSNLLGADLSTGSFERDDSYFFTTRDIRAIGAGPDGWGTQTWGYHQVAWPDDQVVYDACLQVDVDPGTGHVAELPVRMDFGSAADADTYLGRLLPAGNTMKTLPREQKPVA